MSLKHPRIAFPSRIGATLVDILEKDCFVCLIWFCLLCQDRIQKNFKLIENFISARMFHTRHLINIIISLKEKRLGFTPPPFPQILPWRPHCDLVSVITLFCWERSNGLGGL